MGSRLPAAYSHPKIPKVPPPGIQPVPETPIQGTYAYVVVFYLS